jgi:hypothetical protein
MIDYYRPFGLFVCKKKIYITCSSISVLSILTMAFIWPGSFITLVIMVPPSSIANILIDKSFSVYIRFKLTICDTIVYNVC